MNGSDEDFRAFWPGLSSNLRMISLLVPQASPSRATRYLRNLDLLIGPKREGLETCPNVLKVQRAGKKPLDHCAVRAGPSSQCPLAHIREREQGPPGHHWH